MRRRQFIAFLAGAAGAGFVGPRMARAQPPGRSRRIGLLLGSAATDSQSQSNAATLTKALEELGWKENGNLRIDKRWAAADPARAKASAKELVELAPDVIVVGGGGALMAMRDETVTIPIVFVGFTDPVASGLVERLARPGRNMTGFTSVEFSMSGKWLEILKAVADGVTRVTAIYNPETAPYGAQFLRWSQSVATSLAIELTAVPIRDLGEIEAAIGACALTPGGALMVLPDPFNSIHRQPIIALAAQHRVPAIYPNRAYPMAGGLLSYGAQSAYLFQQAASYADRILRGARPGELPVQAPTKFELVVNMQAAKSLGVEVPAALLAIADEVIE